MKQFFKINYLAGICLLASLILFSCNKDKNYKLSKASDNPQASKLDPGMAPPNALLTLTGSGLGDIQTIVFDSGKVRAAFNPAFNTDNAIMFRVPLDAIPAQQHIIFTNGAGKTFSVGFKVLGLPAVTAVSNYDFIAGSQIAITGKNLDDVKKVLLHGTTEEATIISQTKTTLVISMPSSSVDRATLDITNEAGTTTTTQEFINIDKAYGIFKDAFGAGIQDWSWSLVNAPSGVNVMTGATSLQAQYNGSWGGMQLHFDNAVDLSPYKYVSFWIKGGAAATTLDFYFNWSGQQKIAVPADVWTYYKIDLNSFKGAGVSSLSTWIMQIEGNPQTLYLDDVVLSK